MKKVLMYATAFAMTFAFASCGGSGDATTDGVDTTEVVTEGAQVDQNATEEPTDADATTETEDVTPVDSNATVDGGSAE